ncbi:MAG: phosphoglycerate mutase (2,3-diphosphoglycerate-independent) [Flavobacteriaceae bacterium]|nr:phosphoglycerate mutase (2,3-diphosphoglycerate-independent) [Flavobacteriaceae bacterium]
MSKKGVLMILDGWGIGKDSNVSAVELSKTPNIDDLFRKYNYSTLRTDGEYVGLPKGQMGNSEVGHINIGAGRIVHQDLAKINISIQNNKFAKNKTLINGLNFAKKNNKPIHYIGLLSDGGVHSHISHLEELIKITSKYNLKNVFIHAITDGRDVDPKSGINFIKYVNEKFVKYGAVLASVIGRFYAMDRDKRWERIKKSYDLLINGSGIESEDLNKSILNSYKKGITDEFIEPHYKSDKNGKAIGKIKKGDIVIFFNFRSDRARELTEVLSQNEKKEFNMNPVETYYITLTNYNEKYKKIKVIFDKENLKETLGETLSKANKTQLRIAETEKYPHVTYFFNGGKEDPFIGEKRILCPSPKVTTYDIIPEMSAFDVMNKTINYIETDNPDFICINFANPDMVGHTGNLNAAIKACETVDNCLGRIVKKALSKNYFILIIADHGNCEKMINSDGSPNTAHTTNPVPVILVDSKKNKIKSGILSDIAPTILDLMNIDIPKSMDRKSLIV